MKKNIRTAAHSALASDPSQTAGKADSRAVAAEKTQETNQSIYDIPALGKTPAIQPGADFNDVFSHRNGNGADRGGAAELVDQAAASTAAMADTSRAAAGDTSRDAVDQGANAAENAIPDEIDVTVEEYRLIERHRKLQALRYAQIDGVDLISALEDIQWRLILQPPFSSGGYGMMKGEKGIGRVIP